jgi:hypothetical protein
MADFRAARSESVESGETRSDAEAVILEHPRAFIERRGFIQVGKEGGLKAIVDKLRSLKLGDKARYGMDSVGASIEHIYTAVEYPPAIGWLDDVGGLRTAVEEASLQNFLDKNGFLRIAKTEGLAGLITKMRSFPESFQVGNWTLYRAAIVNLLERIQAEKKSLRSKAIAELPDIGGLPAAVQTLVR